MQTRIVLLLLTFFSPVLAYAQVVVDCAQWQAHLSELALSEQQLFESFHDNVASASECEIDDRVVCLDLVTQTFSAKQWSCHSSACESKHITFQSGETAESAVQTSSGWIVTGLATPSGVRADKLVITGNNCAWEGLRWQNIAVSKWDDVAQEVHVHGLPVQSWWLGHYGFLPPSLRVSSAYQELTVLGQIASFEASEHHPVSLSVLGNFTTGDWFGAGLGLATTNATGGLLWSTLEANFGAEQVVTATGDLALHGGDAHRLGAHLELASESIWDLRRLEHNAFLQASPLTILGASLRGPGHELTIRTSMTPQADVDALSIRYGTQFHSDRWISDLDVSHQIQMANRQVHSSDLALRIAYSATRSSVRIVPHLDVLTNFGVIPTESGFEASTSASLMPGFEAAVPFVARFESWTHRVTPRAHASAEVYGFAQRGILPTDVPPFLFTRRPGLIAGQVAVDQVFEASEFRLSVPVGTLLISDRDILSLSPYVSADLDWKQWRLRSVVICEDSCSRVENQSTIGLTTSSTHAEIGVSRGSSFWMIHQMSRSISPLERWRVTALDDTKDQGHARLHTRFKNLGLESLVVTDLSNFGATAGVSWNFGELGWGWAVRAGMDQDGDWSALLGLTMNPTH